MDLSQMQKAAPQSMNPTEKIEWMRKHGAVRARWSDGGELLECELGSPLTERAPKLSEEEQAALAKAEADAKEKDVEDLTYGAA